MISRAICLATLLTPAALAASPPAPALTSDYLVGKWSAFGEDCSHTIEFKKDGTVSTPIGIGKWKVGNGKLTIDYHDGSAPTSSAVKPLSADRIAWMSASGKQEAEKRCK
jgi:hypothetical protein